MPINLTMTHIGTATAILEIDGVKLLTDPVFDTAGAEYDFGSVSLKSTAGPAISIQELPPIDAVLLSHEDHPDNLDNTGRQLLDGRVVMTTVDGANKLQPRPGKYSVVPIPFARPANPIKSLAATTTCRLGLLPVLYGQGPLTLVSSVILQMTGTFRQNIVAALSFSARSSVGNTFLKHPTAYS
ncbi:hypothetical protein BJV82DRAFT_673305 [Fennellomyces sp. T-0311]|nr:hypothetical protein BJV82DRAFT_673305 [Fennellomyces sp. T-0311]